MKALRGSVVLAGLALMAGSGLYALWAGDMSMTAKTFITGFIVFIVGCILAAEPIEE